MPSIPIVGYGVNGDPLHDGKLDLPELIETPSPLDWRRARQFIAQRKWQEAVTYRSTAPHEYTVRQWEPGQEPKQRFEEFTTYIRRFGYADYFGKIRHIYWVVDEFKYWTMGWPVDQTIVINRVHADAPASPRETREW